LFRLSAIAFSKYATASVDDGSAPAPAELFIDSASDGFAAIALVPRNGVRGCPIETRHCPRAGIHEGGIDVGGVSVRATARAGAGVAAPDAGAGADKAVETGGAAGKRTITTIRMMTETTVAAM
jgi:hypothetical protein